MNAFEKALLQAVENDFSDVPAEKDLHFSPVPLKKVRKAHALRRTLLLAAAIAVLASSVFAAYVITYRLGNVDVETDEYEMFHMSIDDDNRYYQLTFEENFANTDAPDLIETYFLPTEKCTAENLAAQTCYIERHEFMSFRPFAQVQDDRTHISVHVGNEVDSPEDIEQIMSAPSTVHYEWDVNGQQITFSQSLAAIAADGTPFVRHVVQDVDTIATTHHKIQIDEYEIFSFEQDFSQHPDWHDKTNAVTRHWYWSDGNYLFSLKANMSEAEMTELFRSVQPVSKNYPYRLEESGSVAENFN